MSGFTLHPTLHNDCHVLGRSRSAWLLLQHDASLPWYLLVPETDVRELHLMPSPARAALRDDMDALARFIKWHHGVPHTNLAVIGNKVSQLHVHVIGRSPDDPCWPGVVWGQLSDGPAWPETSLQAIRRALQAEKLLFP